jgi:Ca2+-binding RTX toxin-like protein
MKVHQPGLARAFGMATSAVVVVGLATAGQAGACMKTPAKASAFVANNTLVITGTRGDDTVVVSQGADPNQLLVDVGGGAVVFDRSTFTAIDVDLGDGNDTFHEGSGIVSDEKLTVRGGRGDDVIETGDGGDLVFGDSGDDSISTGAGNDLVFAGQGDDFVDGGNGADTAFLDGGKDVFQWDPGEGSDFIDGGSGNDLLLFNGAAANETASLSANGHRSVFLRDPGSVRMDMDLVEQLQFNALGGTDNVTVNNMRGTDFRRVGIDLSVAGVPDGAVDNVIVNGSDRNDHVNVTGNGGTVDVAGLAAETTITGADVTDQLHVNTLDGNDRVDVDAGATAIMGVTTDLGAGQH